MAKMRINIVKYLKRLFGNAEEPEQLFTKDIFSGMKYSIGNFTYGHPKVLFENEETNLFIGKYCSISSNVVIFLGGNHRHDWVTTYPFNALNNHFSFATHIQGHPSSNGDVRIGNDVWIGHGVTIMSGITISDGAVLATNAVVTKDVGPYEIWGGNPAKLIKKRFDDVTIQKLLALRWWDKDETFIRENIDILCDRPEAILKKYD